MTDDEIRAAVLADTKLQRLAAANNAQALAAVLSATAGGVRSGEVLTTRGAAARFPAQGALAGPLAFEAAMLALEGYATANADSATEVARLRARSIARMLAVFPTLGLDFGDPALRDTLDTLVPDAISADQAAGLKSLAATAPMRLSARQVATAIGQVMPAPPTEGPAWIT